MSRWHWEETIRIDVWNVAAIDARGVTTRTWKILEADMKYHFAAAIQSSDVTGYAIRSESDQEELRLTERLTLGVWWLGLKRSSKGISNTVPES